MSVLAMKRVLICSTKQNRKGILETLQRAGAVEIVRNDALQDEIFTRQDTSSAKAIFQKNASLVNQAIGILEEHAPEQKGMLDSLAGRKELTVAEYERKVKDRDESIAACNEIIALEKEYAEALADVPKLEAQLVALEPWLNYDLPLDYPGTRKTSVFVGTLPGYQTLADVTTKLAELAPEVETVEVQLISQTPQLTYVFIVCLRRDAEAISDALHKMNFAKPPLEKLNPKEATEQITREIEKSKKKAEEVSLKIAAFVPRRDDFKFASDYFTMRVDKYEVLGGLDQSNHTFLLEGYVPAVKAKKLEDLITTKFDAVVEFSDPTEEEDTPVLLKNNGFTAPVETVVESYSLPSKGEIDPSFLVSLFYYVLFGMMLGDAGYGLIIALATGICLLKFKGMEKGMKKTLTMFFFCGVSTAIWGVIFGSFFGDTVNVVASTFFNRPDVTVKALWFEPINEPMRMMAFCFLVGLIHLFTGLGAKLYELLKAGKVLDAIYDVVFWYMLVGGAVIYLLSMPMITNMLAITWLMPANVAKIASYVAIVGAIGIILTGGRDSKNWGIRIAKGLYSFYGITSYLSDVLSYSRLLALGLATSVIASVFNKMGSMGGSGIVGVIMFILVFLVGQTLNLLINLLGAYVHTNRLQFVEFFGKFYEGGGRAFEPFTENTKYFKIKEDM